MNRIKFISIATALTIVSACGCNKHVQPTPEEPFERYQQNLVMHSDILDDDIKYTIYLPENYDTDESKSYPVVYMLHGLGDNCNSWNGKYLHANNVINELKSKGLSDMIYVFPTGYSTYYCNFYNGSYNYMDMFIEEFIPYIDKTYRTIADKQHRSITGYSMGGFGALVLPEKHPDMFCCSAPLSMSFRTDQQYMTEETSGWNGQWGRIFGGMGKGPEGRLSDYYKSHCPYYQFTEENKASLETVKWYFTCGDDEEQLLIANDSLHVVLRDRNYTHEYRVGDGAHTSTYWNTALMEVLPWFDYWMNGNNYWIENNTTSYTTATVSFNEDGSAQTSAFSKDEAAAGVFMFYEDMTKETIQKAISVLYTTDTKTKAIYLPCNLAEKSLQEWIASYSESYNLDRKIAVGFGDAGATVMENKASFDAEVFVDAKLGEFETCEGEKYYFACTDDSENYRDMGGLYCSCKRSGATFEYRVINAGSDSTEDTFRCLNKIKSYIFN